MTTDIVEVAKSQRKIDLRAQQRAEAQVRRSQFNHDQALSRIEFSRQEAHARLQFKHDVIEPAIEELERQVNAGELTETAGE